MTRPLFRLGSRLALCAWLVRRGSRVIDVGTDHAYLPIWLLKSGGIKSAVACDINPGPLETAKANGEKYEVGESLRFVLSDGLQGLSSEDGEDIVIAGMGGELILRIISDAPWLKSPEKRLVLQPMSSVPLLRMGLRELGFSVLEEQAVIDGGKPYSAFSAVYIGKQEKTDLLYPYLGKLPSAGEAGDSAEALKRYGEKVLRELENQRRGAEHGNDKEEAARLKAIMEGVAARCL